MMSTCYFCGKTGDADLSKWGEDPNLGWHHLRCAHDARDRTMALKAGVPLDPKLPRNFDDTRNEDRPRSHQRWWGRPYIQRDFGDGHPDPSGWLKAWPSGVRYNVRCLDGGAWDRSTSWGMFATIEEAIHCATVRAGFGVDLVGALKGMRHVAGSIAAHHTGPKGAQPR